MSRAAAEAALAAYGLAGAALTPIRGTNNDVYEVQPVDGDRRVLRVHRPGYRSSDQIAAELALPSGVTVRDTSGTRYRTCPEATGQTAAASASIAGA